MTYKSILFTPIIFGLAACISSYPPRASATITCSAQTCAQVWQRAQIWVVQHSAYRVRMATDAVIETFGPLQRGDGLAYQITRVGGHGEAGVITAYASCWPHEWTGGCIGQNPQLGIQAFVAAMR